MYIYPKQTEDGTEIGIDEAGRGCLWGPLFAAAVLLPENDLPQEFIKIAEQIKDSKKLTQKRRNAIYTSLKNSGIVYGIGRVEHDEIDTRGATWANQTAFRRALDQIKTKCKKNILIDGTLGLRETLEGETWKTEVDGDARFLSIATASILAKEARDEWVKEWCENNKESAERYSLVSSKGYGTKKHRDAIVEKGLLPFHRRLYCRKLIPGLIVNRYELIDD
jgi:ribonuclease HII